MKVSFFNKKLLKLYGSVIAVLSTIISFIQIFYELPDDCKIKLNVAIAFLICMLVLYIIVFIYSNKKKSVSLRVNDTVIKVFTGDILKQPGLKVIPFNEYFDTIVDDKLISSNTLNGQFILNHVDDVKALDTKIKQDKRLQRLQIAIDQKRSTGKEMKYPLGTIYKNNDYLLLAFSSFDSENRAYLTKDDIIKCLLNMWNEIDVVYNGYSINIPLLGAGITRFAGITLSKQELLEILIMSFKLSGIKLEYNANINIIIYKDSADDISFFKLKDFL